jgi:hypothetical protein
MEKKFTDLIQEDNEWLGFKELKKIDTKTRFTY